MSSCALSRAKLARYVAELREAGGREKATTAIKAGFVGSIVTPMRALAGNASWGGLRHIALQPTEAAVDYMLSVGRSVKSGGKIRPHEFREVANALDADGVAALWGGFKKGTEPTRSGYKASGLPKFWKLQFKDFTAQRVASFVREVSTRLDAEHIYRSLDYDQVKYKNPVAQTLVDGAFTVLEAVDRPFWRMAFDGSIYMQSKLLAVREGLKGKAMKDRAREYFENPTDEMALRATDDAHYATFKDRGVLSTMATSLKRTTSAAADQKIPEGTTGYALAEARARKKTAAIANVGLELTMPFTGVPSSVAGKMAAVSPLGLLSPKILGSQAERARALAAAGVGTAMMAAAIELYRQGQITGARPDNASERAQWEEAGIQPYSVKIGDYWVGIKALGPVFASQAAMGVALAKAWDEADDPAKVITKGIGGATKFLSEQTYLTSIGRIKDAIEGEGSIAGVAVSMIPTPAFIGQANRAIDPKQRDTRAVKDRLLSKLPGGTFLTPERVGPGGVLPDKTVPERLSSVASPFWLSKSRDTALLKELRRLEVSFGFPARTIRQDGVTKRLSDSQFREFIKTAGPETIAELWSVVSHPEYPNASDEERKAALDAVVREVRAAHREPIKAQLFNTPPPTVARQ